MSQLELGLAYLERVTAPLDLTPEDQDLIRSLRRSVPMVDVDGYRDGRNWIEVGHTVKVVFHTKQQSCLARVLAIRAEPDSPADVERLDAGEVVEVWIAELDVILTTQCDGIGRAPKAGMTRTLTPDCIHRIARTRNGHPR